MKDRDVEDDFSWEKTNFRGTLGNVPLNGKIQVKTIYFGVLVHSQKLKNYNLSSDLSNGKVAQSINEHVFFNT